MNQDTELGVDFGRNGIMKAIITFIGVLISLAATATSLQLASQTDASFSPSVSGGGDSVLPVISHDGRFVLFASSANNLALTTNNTPFHAPLFNCLNVFLRDRSSNTATLVSVNMAGTGGSELDAIPTGISTNGQFAVFESVASNLVLGDTNSVSDVFVRDLVNGTTILVSVSTNGGCGNGSSYSSVITPDGRYVAFTSTATNLVAGDTNGIADVFVRDLQNGTTRLASLGAKTTNSTTFTSFSDTPAITPDGRYVAFYSSATNLVPGVKFGGEIYVRDLVAGTTTWASIDARSLSKTLTGSSNVVSCNLQISDDGNYVAYEVCTNAPAPTSARGIILRYSLTTGLTDVVHTNAYVPLTSFENIQNLDMTPDGRFIALVANVSGTAGTNTAIYLWDAQTGTNILVSANTNNTLPAINFCDEPAVSSNGQYVAFFSGSAELATNVIGQGPFLYLRDVLTGTTRLVNTDTNGVSTGDTTMLVIGLSANGQFVTFESAQSNLVTNDYNHDFDVFVRDTATSNPELISVRHPQLPSRTSAGSSLIANQPISQDGHYLAFASEADSLVAGDTNRLRDVFACDLFNGSNVLVSVGTNGANGNGGSFEPALSGSGRFVAFTSLATNLISRDTNNSTDIFVRDLQANATTLVSVNSSGTGEGNKDSYSPTISSDGRFVLFNSKASNLTAGSFSGTDNLFLSDRQIGTNYALTTTGQAYAAMTPDGHFIAFTDTAGSSSGNIYLWDTQLAKRVATNTTVTGILGISISPDGNRIACFAGSSPVALSTWDRSTSQTYSIASGYRNSRSGFRFNASGQFLAFALSSTATVTNQVYLYDFQTQINTLVSHGVSSVVAGSDFSDSPDISADGRFVIFRSAAANIVAGDTNGVPDIFLFDRATGLNSILSSGSYGNVSADNRSSSPIFSGDGHTLAFKSWGTDLMSGDFNQSGDVFVFAFLYAAITADSSSAPTINWPAASGQTYNVEYKDELTDPSWQPVAGTVTILGNRGYLTDSTLASGHRFYRVISNSSN